MKLPAAFASAFLVLVSTCRAQDSPTTDELHAKIKALTDQQLVKCLKEKSTFNLPAAFNSPAVVPKAASIVPDVPSGCLLTRSVPVTAMIDIELAERKHPDLLIAAYRDADSEQRFNLVRALAQIDDPKVVAFMSAVAFGFQFPREGSPEALFEASFAIEYLADRCHEPALKRLSDWAPLGQMAALGCGIHQWRPVVEAFVRCDYRAAAPKLLAALRAPCAEINDAAEEGLRGFFPGSCEQTHSIEEQESCYEKLIEDSTHSLPPTTDH